MPRRNRTPTDEITLHYWNLRRQVLLAGRYAWEITLDEYLALWLPHWAQRKGATRGASLVVARTGATGPTGWTTSASTPARIRCARCTPLTATA